jgi:MoxR-like ATPase
VTVATDSLNDDQAAQKAQAKTAQLDQLIRDNHGRVVISAEVQALVRQAIDAAIRFCDIERRFKARDGNKAQLTKEARDANNGFQRARSDLMQRLAADVLWDRSVQRSGYKVANIVLEVLPAKPHAVLK